LLKKYSNNFCLAPTTTVCSISCQNGFRDEESGNCRCCDFDAYPKYLEYATSLEKTRAEYDKTGSGDIKIEAKIIECQDTLDQLRQNVLDNCGNKTVNLDTYFFSIRADLLDLQFQVTEFASSLVPNSNCDSRPKCSAALPQRNYKDCTCFCPVKCNSTADQVFIRPKCECQFFANYSEIIAKKAEVQSLITQLSQVLRQTDFMVKFRQDLMNEVTKYRNFIAELETNWNKTTIQVKEKKVLDLFTFTGQVMNRVKSFIGSGPCRKACPKYNVVYSKDCTCYTTTEIKQFFTRFNNYLSTESSIINFDFKNKTADDTYWTQRSREVRDLAVKFNTAVTDNILTTQQQSEMVTQFIALADKLAVDWKAYQDSLKNPSPKCTITTCSGDTVKNCATCQCVPITSFNDLNTRVANGVDALLTSIETLSVLDETQKQILRNNANLIKNGRTALNTYTADFCSNLDETYTQLRTLELVGWFDKLAADIKAIKDTKVTKVCNLACPNSIWKYDPTACKCDCSKTCIVGVEVFDSYNCLCSKKTSCAKTQTLCDATNQLLDYANCLCKSKPVKK
jgi:hypothetical protein